MARERLAGEAPNVDNIPPVPPGERRVERGDVAEVGRKYRDLEALRLAAGGAVRGAGLMAQVQARAPEGFAVRRGNGGWIYGVKGEGAGAQVMVLYDPRHPEREAFAVRQEGPYKAIIAELFPGAAGAGPAKPAAQPGGTPVPKLDEREAPPTPKPPDESATGAVQARMAEAARARKAAVAETFKDFAGPDESMMSVADPAAQAQMMADLMARVEPYKDKTLGEVLKELSQMNAMDMSTREAVQRIVHSIGAGSRRVRAEDAVRRAKEEEATREGGSAGE